MTLRARHLCLGLLILAILLALLLAGPIAQPAGYHDFADARGWLGLPRAADVLSNLGFLLVGSVGLIFVSRRLAREDGAAPGYRLFFLALLATAAGSAFYHLAPDNSRLVWDRLPIAVASAALLAAALGERLSREAARGWALVLSVLAVFSVVWWQRTEQIGAGDLRPYLAMQFLPVLVLPALAALYPARRGELAAYGQIIGLYLLAKVCELADGPILQLTGVVSGHTLKHLLAALAAARVLFWLHQRRLA